MAFLVANDFFLKLCVVKRLNLRKVIGISPVIEGKSCVSFSKERVESFSRRVVLRTGPSGISGRLKDLNAGSRGRRMVAPALKGGRLFRDAPKQVAFEVEVISDGGHGRGVVCTEDEQGHRRASTAHCATSGDQ